MTDKKNNQTQLGWYLISIPSQIKNEFFIIREYIETSEKFLMNKLEDIDKEEHREYNTISEYITTNKNYQYNEITRILRNNCFVSVVSLLEAHFRMIVDCLPNKPALLVKELSGTELEKPYIYLTKILGYNMQSLKNDHCHLIDYYSLRNRLVHHLGYLDVDTTKRVNEQKGIYKFVKSLSHIDINAENGKLSITDKSFTIEFCNKAEFF